MDAAIQKSAKKTFSAVGFALLIFFAVSLGTQFLLGALYSLLFPKLPLLRTVPIADFLLFASASSMYLFGLPALLLFLRKKERHPPKKASVRFDEVAVLFFIAVFFLYFGNNIGAFVGGLFENTGLALQNTTVNTAAAATPWLTILFSVCLAPVVEEFIFRKTIIDCVGAYGEKLAILFSALLFGFFHVNLYQFFYAVLIGLLLGYVYVRTGRVWVCMLLHAAFNFWGALPLLLEKYTHIYSIAEDFAKFETQNDPQALFDYLFSNLPGMTVMYQYALAANVIVALGAVLFFLFSRRLWFQKSEMQLPRDSEGVTAFAAPGVLLFVLFSLALTIYESYAVAIG